MAYWNSNSYDGRYLQLSISESVDVINNSSTLYWTLSSIGGSVKYYSIAPTTVTINGTVVYSKGKTAWDDKVFPAATGSVSGSIIVYHNSDGTKGISVGFSTRVWYAAAEEYGGWLTLSSIDRSAPSISISTGGITASSVNLTATASTTCSVWDYTTDNWATYRQYSTSSTTRTSITITGLSPNTNYTIAVRARKQYNGVVGWSGTNSIKTLGNSLLNSVSTLTVDVINPVITLNLTVYAAYTHSLVIKDGSTTVLTLSGITCSTGTNNKTLVLTSAQRNTILTYMSNKKTFNATYCLTTYSGSTQIGSTVAKTALIQTTASTSSPTFQNFTHSDTNSTTVGITQDNSKYIKGYSYLQVLAYAATAKNGATISSYKITVGATSKSYTSTTMNFGNISVSGNITLRVEAIDSRGYSTAVDKTISVVDYSDISITDYFIRRKNEVESTVILMFSGELSPISIANIAQNNLVSAKFRYAINGGTYSGWNTLTAESTSYSFSFSTIALSNSSGIIEFDSNSQYSIQIRVTDKLSIDIVTLILNKGTPLVALRSKKVGINTPDPQSALDVNGDIMMNGQNVQGYIRNLNGEDFNTLTQSGIYHYGVTAINAPTNTIGLLEVLTINANFVLQRFIEYTTGNKVYIRTKNNSSWTTWRQL